LVGSPEAKKVPVPGLVSFFSRFFIVFLNSPHRETPKNVIKQNREKIGLGFFVDCFVKTFRHDTRFFCKTFFVVLLNSHRKETPKKAIKQKKAEEKRQSNFLSILRIFSEKVFDMDFLHFFL
jgi:ubiquitin C-terminal hydrolase